MWTILTAVMGNLKPRTVALMAGCLFLVCVLSYAAVRQANLKAELATTTAALTAVNSRLLTCEGTISSYQAATAKLAAEHAKALEKASQVSARTRQIVKTLRTQPIDNSLDSIQKQGLSTAPAAVELWAQ